MIYDIIFVTGEPFFDYPLCGVAILKRLLEKYGYTVGLITMPKNDSDIKKLGKPKLFFGVTSGSIDSMVRNYTPLNKKRSEDTHTTYMPYVPDRAVIVYSNWIKQHFKGSIIVIGGVEASMRRFAHFDYWSNTVRKSILFDSKTDILVYGNGEKQILEIADRVKNNLSLKGIKGTCIREKTAPGNFTIIPSFEEVFASKEKFCDMQNSFSNYKNLAQKTGDWFVLQYEYPDYTSHDLDEYYELPYTRKVDSPYLKGFTFSVVTHRGCIGNCNFCSLRLLQGDKIISRSEDSIIREITRITKLPNFKGTIDDLGGPSANMYGMDCKKCRNNCIDCAKLDRTNNKLINLLRRVRKIKGVKHVYVRSGVRYDLASNEYIKELIQHHISGSLKIAPEHVSKKVLKLMNKDKGDFDTFVYNFKKMGGELKYYFMTGHPGSTIKEAKELSNKIKQLGNTESVQLFTPTPMTESTCMYYTGLNPKTREPVFVPRGFREKKEQKRAIYNKT
ncbi:Ribosomal protein S12 methylthiotransferase RimO [Candidatus Tiddalikarchaeum anstoanum]|nr:Ribosomal protein S12 methylthiotransferase RimO [Candidatus Tiddalikarchaeum anstoanum]